jgi:putative spermidine/putrescine transport system ATP-binding protein
MYGRPATPCVAEFIGTMNRLVSTVGDEGMVEHGDRRLRVDAARGLPRGERVLLLVRPETVEIAVMDDGSEPDGSIVGEVVSHIFLGSVTRVRVDDPASKQGITADIAPWRANALPVGTRVAATFPADSGRLLSLVEQPELVAADPDDR